MEKSPIEQNSKQLPPPPLLSDLKPPELVLDPTIKKMMDLHPTSCSSISQELQVSQKPKSHTKIVVEGVGDPKEPRPINKQIDSECPICLKWCLKSDMAMHKQSHGSKILDFLYLGGWECANSLKELSERVRCSYILNCAMECTNAFPERFQYMKLELQDNFGEDITKEFESSFAFIEQAKNDRKVVLVHCMQGRSRSVTIVLAYLMKYNQMTLREAYEQTKICRPEISPNPNYISRLRKYEYKLYGKNSIMGHEILPVYKFLYRHEYESENRPEE